jgi:hypothetical protein
VLGRIKSTARAHPVRIREGPPFAKNAEDGPPGIMLASKGAPPASAYGARMLLHSSTGEVDEIGRKELNIGSHCWIDIHLSGADALQR